MLKFMQMGGWIATFIIDGDWFKLWLLVAIT